MSDEIRIAHRRGHSSTLHERAAEDVARANTIVSENDAVLAIGAVFDGEMLVVDGQQIVSEPIPESSVSVGSGLAGDGSSGDPLTLDFGTGTNQVRRGDDAAFTNARTPTAHAHAIGDLTGVAATSHTHAVSDLSSGVIALARMLASVLSGAPIRINAAGTALEALWPNIVVNPGQTITTTPAASFTVTLPEAGTYLIEQISMLSVTTVTGTRTVTMRYDITNMTSMSLWQIKGTSAPAYNGAEPLTSSGGTFTMGLLTNQKGDWRVNGTVTVSAAAVLTVTSSISGDTAGLKNGSFVRATRLS